MCGIYGYVGKSDAIKKTILGLKKLEYRGYDSAGIAFINQKNEVEVVKSVGKVESLQEKIKMRKKSEIAIAHTRWATHGKATLSNCHPHFSENFYIVHNGIIENFNELKKEINCKLYSDTDSEIIAKLLEINFDKNLEKKEEINENILNSIKKVSQKLIGSWGVAFICKKMPEKIYVFKNKIPIVVGSNGAESAVSSDINAINIEETGENVYNALLDGNIAEISKRTIKIYDKNLNLISLEKSKKECFFEEQKLNHKYMMIKEIDEIPNSIKNTKKSLKNKKYYDFISNFKNFRSITIIGCGTAYHAGLYGKYILEKLTKKRVTVELASEFRYKTQLENEKSLVLAISQSGETADTIAGLSLAREFGATTACITNVCGSTITRICDYVFQTKAGQEIAVCATKSYVSQMFVLYAIAYSLSKKRMCAGIEKLLQETIETFNESVFKPFYNKNKFFFIGRLSDGVTAFEGALKLKEISYVHSEGYCAGELKHGTLSLIDNDCLAIAIITQQSIKDKTLNAVHEIMARGGETLVVSQFNFNGENVLSLPKCNEEVMPMVSIIPLQLFSFHFALSKGLDPDMPRNLAKSVTVE